VALCTVMDDADIHDWESPRDFTPRLIRAMVAGVRAEPRLNGTFSAETGVLSMSEDVHMGLAMETPHGLIVATIFNAGKLSLDELRDEVARLKKAGADRTLKPGEVRGYTVTLSNIAGGSSRYATPLMVPPTVGILGSGAAREEVVAVNGEIAIRRVLPLSLTFDHRCVAGADASRFLGAVVADLKLAS
ncbi:MAG: 2-oxo acid dehydrogenase subunit E2, partial [Gammaproteobacteria bacterium]|nr:2-oxo acid dehydrogenase subunit E2 [Gammaproteobacteria bacterium]